MKGCVELTIAYDLCRVLLCLKRALRIANAVQQMTGATRGTSGPMTLFVEILNTYVLNALAKKCPVTAVGLQFDCY